MSTRCLGITTKGVQCQIKPKGSAYCRYHLAQGNTVVDCPAPPKKKPVEAGKKKGITPRRRVSTLAPLKETPLQESSTIRDVTEEQEDIHGETCCVCLDQEVPSAELLSCKHPVCVPCLQQLTKTECPTCRAKLGGPSVTGKIFSNIIKREQDDILAEENANLLVALALQEDPNLDPTELYDRFYQTR